MKEPWYRHILGGQARSADEVEELATTLLVVLASFLVGGIITSLALWIMK